MSGYALMFYTLHVDDIASYCDITEVQQPQHHVKICRVYSFGTKVDLKSESELRESIVEYKRRGFFGSQYRPDGETQRSDRQILNKTGDSELSHMRGIQTTLALGRF